MACLGNEQRSCCCFWDCIQVLHFGLLLTEGYSISSKRFLPTVIDILVIWIKFAHFHPLKLSSVQFSCLVVSNSLWPHGLQHSRLPYPSLIPRDYSNSCPLNQWCHTTISSSVIHFSFHLQSSPASGSFQMSQFFASGGPSIEASASALILSINIQDWFPLGLTSLISL